MAYDKHTWISGETITATELNDMESGIENNSERLDELTETVNKNTTDIDGKLDKSSVTSSLTSTSTTDALSASAGKTLNDAIVNKVMFVDGSNKTAFNARLTAVNMSFSNGVGSVTVETEGRSLSKNAFAVARKANTSLSVAYVVGESSNNTITVGLTNTSYSGTVLFLFLYFLG